LGRWYSWRAARVSSNSQGLSDMQNVNWEEVNRRFTSAQKAATLLRG
jgi:hypothetical protein